MSVVDWMSFLTCHTQNEIKTGSNEKPVILVKMNSLKKSFALTLLLSCFITMILCQESLSDKIDRIVSDPERYSKFDDAYDTVGTAVTQETSGHQEDSAPKQPNSMSAELIALCSIGGSVRFGILVAILRFCAQCRAAAEVGVQVGDAAWQLFLRCRAIMARFQVRRPRPTRAAVIALPAP